MAERQFLNAGVFIMAVVEQKQALDRATFESGILDVRPLECTVLCERSNGSGRV